MRILLVAYAVIPESGSEPGNSWRFAAELASAGHDVTLLTASSVDPTPGNGRRLKVITVEPPGRPRFPSHLGVYVPYLRWQRAVLRRARALLRAGETFDVAHHYSWGSLVWGTSLVHLPLPVLFGPVGSGSTAPLRLLPAMRPSDAAKELARTLAVGCSRLNPLSRTSARRATLTLASNTASAQLVERLGGRAVVALTDTAPPLAPLHGAPCAPRSTRDLLWVGRAIPRKGLLLAVETVRYLPSGFRLRVIGEGPELRRARERARRLGVLNRIEFLGRLPWQEVLEEMDGADALLFTSIRDAFGSQILEAASRGLPIVAIDHHGAHDHLPPAAGDLVRLAGWHRMPRLLAAAACDVTSTDLRNRRARAAARQFATDRQPGQLVDEVVDHYSTAIRLWHRTPLRAGRPEGGTG